MKTMLAMLVAVTLSSAASVPLAAHHSFAAEFDVKQPVLFKGTVTKMEWINPQRLDPYERDAAEWQDRSVDGRRRCPTVLFRRGFSKTLLQAGTQIVVDGYRAKDGTNKMNAREITFADGRNTVCRLRGHRRTAIIESALPDRGLPST